MALVITGTINVPCYHSDNGSITNLNITGGTGPYTYQWSTGSTASSINGIVAGVYWVKVTDSLGATGEKAFVVGENPAMWIDFDVSKACPGGTLSGHLNYEPQGNPSYLWNTGETTESISVEAGTYTLTITDPDTGCTVTESIQVLTAQQIDIFRFKCCAGQLAYKYIRQMEGGQLEKAECSMNKLKLLNGYIKDLCDFIPVGTVLIAAHDACALFAFLDNDTKITTIQLTVNGVFLINISLMSVTLQQMIDYIVANVSQGFTATDMGDGAFELCTSDTSYNGATAHLHYVGDNGHHDYTKILSGGVDQVLQTAEMNCQGAEDIALITEKANSLCGCPCDDKDIFADTLIP